MSILINAYSTCHTQPELAFPHHLDARRDLHDPDWLKWYCLFQAPCNLSLKADLIAKYLSFILIGWRLAIISRLGVGVLFSPLVIMRAACRCTVSSLTVM